MPREILVAFLLVVITVAIHAVGFSVLIRGMMRSHALNTLGFLPVIRFVIVLTCWLLLIHLAEITVWGAMYFWEGCMPDAGTGFYFSAVTYTTLGDGALMLPKAWRMFAPLEALTAVLMCGLSTGLFFAVVSWWITNWMKRQTALEAHSPQPES
jgi:hypothetical protein